MQIPIVNQNHPLDILLPSDHVLVILPVLDLLVDALQSSIRQSHGRTILTHDLENQIAYLRVGEGLTSEAPGALAALEDLYHFSEHGQSREVGVIGANKKETPEGLSLVDLELGLLRHCGCGIRRLIVGLGGLL